MYGDSAIININDLTIVINNYRIEAQNYPYFSFYEVDDKPQEGIYDFEKKKILFEATSWLGRSIIDKYIFRDFKKKIACRKIDSDSILWEFPLSSLGKWKNSWDEERDFEIRHFIGIYNGIIWAFIEIGGFIGLDIETGELKYRISEYHMGKESKLFFRSDYYLDNERGKIFGLAHIFIEIDLNQDPPFVTQYGLQEEFEKYNIKKANDTAEDFVVQDNLLYFYLAEQLKFGVLDINTKEIIYISEPIAVVERDDSFTRLRDLKVSENKVYILDSNHTLHVFEREKLNFELGTSCKLAPVGEAKSYYRN